MITGPEACEVIHTNLHQIKFINIPEVVQLARQHVLHARFGCLMVQLPDKLLVNEQLVRKINLVYQLSDGLRFSLYWPDRYLRDGRRIPGATTCDVSDNGFYDLEDILLCYDHPEDNLFY